MIKWFAYIVLLLIIAPGLSSAKKRVHSAAPFYNVVTLPVHTGELKDTTTAKNVKPHQPDATDDKKKIKEIAKARRQPKPEKIVPADDAPAAKKQKPKRQRRPEGLEQPPEIPRRNDN